MTTQGSRLIALHLAWKAPVDNFMVEQELINCGQIYDCHGIIKLIEFEWNEYGVNTE